MAAEGGVIVTYIFTGEEERNEEGHHIIPENVTHLLFHESVTVIPRYLFYEHPNIIEVYCHAGVKRIKRLAFYNCPRLRRLIIPGVEVVEARAFSDCEAVTDIECAKLERIEVFAFYSCKSLSNINLPSARVVEAGAFGNCEATTEAKFGKNLESIRTAAFVNCTSLESITIPLKNGLFAHDNIFAGCSSLKNVYLIEQEVLYETIDALLLEERRNDINEEMDSINQILPNARLGYYDGMEFTGDAGGKTLAIWDWIVRVLRKIIDYKAEHRRLLSEATAILQLVLPNDIVMTIVLPFLDLPAHTFNGEPRAT